MKGWIGGLVAGVVLGTAVTGVAQTRGWETAMTHLESATGLNLHEFHLSDGIR
jgi:hypothetical protein